MTNYVATNTFTDHTGTNATHGCAAIASAAAIPNNASFTLAGLSERDYSSLTGTPTSAPWNGSATSNLDMGDGMAIQIATGTVANLSFRLRSDPDTGFFSDSANTIKIVCGGFTSLTLGNNSFAIGAATIALPSITGNIAQSANSFLIYGRVASSTQPTYSWYIDDCGLGRYAVGQPSMVAGGGIEAQRWTASGTQVYTNAIITPLGGTGIKLTASGTAAFTYGQVVTVGSITNGIFVVNPTDGQGPIGVVYGRVDLATSTVAIGSDAWIIVSGIAEVQGDAVGFGPGALVIAGSAGQGKDPGSIPPATQNEHNAEIGHAIGTGRAGTVGKVVLHFN
jgi:hypothetical protein